MEKVVRIQHGQMTVAFQKLSSKFAQVKQNSFSVIYTNNNGEETSLDLIAPAPQVFQYWFDGLKIVLKKIRHLRESATLEERYYKAKFDAADEDGSGTLDSAEVVDIICSMNIEMSKDVIKKMIDEVDVDKNGTLDFDEFSQLLTTLRRRPELESLWITVVNNTYKPNDLNPLELNLENNDTAKNIRAATITSQQLKDFWNVIQGDDLSMDVINEMIKNAMPPNSDPGILSFGGFSIIMVKIFIFICYYYFFLI